MGMPGGDTDDAGTGMLSADTVGYHEDAQNCGNCKHNQQGQCDVIGQQVSDEGGCHVWEAGGGGGGEMASPEGMSPEGMAPGAGGGRSMYGS